MDVGKTLGTDIFIGFIENPVDTALKHSVIVVSRVIFELPLVHRANDIICLDLHLIDDLLELVLCRLIDN